MSEAAFKGIEDVCERFGGAGYICDRNIATVVYLADRMGKPILAEGPPGVGKTELGKAVAQALGAELIRLQCYEGLDETKALYEWEYAKQLLYTQILKEKLDEILSGAATLSEAVDRIAGQDDVFYSRRFILPRPLLRAVMCENRPVLLVDEIDRADPEFEAFLLEILSDFQVSIPELGTIRAARPPFVVLTSNNTRELSDALKRRCLYLHIDYPDRERETEIIRLKVPEAREEIARRVAGAVRAIRGLDIKKAPSVSESIDWARALTILNAKSLDKDTLLSTLGAVLKFEEDVKTASAKAADILADPDDARGRD